MSHAAISEPPWQHLCRRFLKSRSLHYLHASMNCTCYHIKDPVYGGQEHSWSNAIHCNSGGSMTSCWLCGCLWSRRSHHKRLDCTTVSQMSADQHRSFRGASAGHLVCPWQSQHFFCRFKLWWLPLNEGGEQSCPCNIRPQKAFNVICSVRRLSQAGDSVIGKASRRIRVESSAMPHLT